MLGSRKQTARINKTRRTITLRLSDYLLAVIPDYSWLTSLYVSTEFFDAGCRGFSQSTSTRLALVKYFLL